MHTELASELGHKLKPTRVHRWKPLRVGPLCELPGPLRAKHTEVLGVANRPVIKSFLFSIERGDATHLDR